MMTNDFITLALAEAVHHNVKNIAKRSAQIARTAHIIATRTDEPDLRDSCEQLIAQHQAGQHAHVVECMQRAVAIYRQNIT